MKKAFPLPILRLRLWLAVFGACLLLVSQTFPTAHAQSLSSQDRERGHVILDRVKDDLLKNYYDPNYHGMDVEARFQAAEEKFKQATTLGQVFGIIGQTLLDLNDSHSFFVPPLRASRTDYGWQMQMIGDVCYVVGVKPGSDAEAKGLKVGDAVLTLDGFSPTRANLWKMQYSYYALRPRPGMRLVVLVDSNSASAAELFARVIQLEKRGTVIGDRSAGAVITSEHFGHETGVGRVLYYGTSVTIADMLMTDGKSLEDVGVTPDEVVQPTGADLAAKRDPVLSRAAALVGVKLDVEKAGALFPVEWR